jgi:hypothetical protein
MQQQRTRRRSAGFIDVEFYRREAEQLCSEALANCFKRAKGSARLLLNLTVMFAPLMFGPLKHGIAVSELTDHRVAVQVTPPNLP